MFKDKKVLILGMARSGYEAAKVLVERGNKVILNDNKEEDKQDALQVKELRDIGVEFVFGSHPDDLLDDTFDYLIKNPGVPIDHKYVLKARKSGIEVINEVEMAYRLLPNDIKLIGITGTNGKTTTTTITYEIMKKAFGDKVHLAGNIGYPLSSILKKLKSGDIIVMEVSCQQGENIKEFRPDIGLFTNLDIAHVDFMKTIEHYREVKARMFFNQTNNDIAILNIEDDVLTSLLKDIKSEVKYFSGKNIINGTYLKGESIYYYEDKVMSIENVKIAGKHNLENIMGAIMIAKEFNISNDIINDVVSNFTGVEHRLEYVDTKNQVRFYNDTEATNIKCTQIALSSFDNPMIIILGGLERGQRFEELLPFMKNVKGIVAIGQCRDRVLKFGKDNNFDTYSFEYLKDAFVKCVEISEPGDVILLSPASASWDQYKECEIRGAEFKDLVKNIK